ncbi:MAG: retroviral-like aspartic protease family protein [Candidatus Edwardsbacteria bacterium]
MGRIVVKAKIWNFGDELESLRGLKKPEEIVKIEVEGLIDTGATALVLPLLIVKKLRLLVDGREVEVTYANGKRGKRKVARGVAIEILGREMETFAVVENKEARVLIGQIILEGLDLYPNPKEGRLEPRPGHPDMPLIELY